MKKIKLKVEEFLYRISYPTIAFGGITTGYFAGNLLNGNRTLEDYIGLSTGLIFLSTSLFYRNKNSHDNAGKILNDIKMINERRLRLREEIGKTEAKKERVEKDLEELLKKTENTSPYLN